MLRAKAACPNQWRVSSAPVCSVSGAVRDRASEGPAAGREEQERDDGRDHLQPEAGQGAAAAGAHQEGRAHLRLPAGPAATR